MPEADPVLSRAQQVYQWLKTQSEKLESAQIECEADQRRLADLKSILIPGVPDVNSHLSELASLVSLSSTLSSHEDIIQRLKVALKALEIDHQAVDKECAELKDSYEECPLCGNVTSK